MVKCDSCGANVDLAKDSNMGHCATCNNIVEVNEQQPAPQEEQSKAAVGSQGATEKAKK
ncbi:hypothetical protein B0A50_08031 [Salinomyces thailandicus]|uniref:Uncharacterized protein n=1 Tax=Salinomyces thailandicus TaxID=706561 RepID=A0A4U0TKR5_9PEZI|nr:hypothetical protein B0A50_08031 [Salinomyces thailandica]